MDVIKTAEQAQVVALSHALFFAELVPRVDPDPTKIGDHDFWRVRFYERDGTDTPVLTNNVFVDDKGRLLLVGYLGSGQAEDERILTRAYENPPKPITDDVAASDELNLITAIIIESLVDKDEETRPVGVVITKRWEYDGHIYWEYHYTGDNWPLAATRTSTCIRDDRKTYALFGCLEHTIEQVVSGEVAGPQHLYHKP